VIGTELEDLLRKLIRAELDRLLSGESPANDDDDLRRRVAERAASMRKARGGSR
jgi:hypothetical protein